MNTKIIMKSSALLLGFTGLMLTFFPQELSESLGHTENDMMTRSLEVIGAMYLAFGMMNWMSRKSLIGGIYNRPIAIANMTHFMMVGIILTKWTVGAATNIAMRKRDNGLQNLWPARACRAELRLTGEG